MRVGRGARPVETVCRSLGETRCVSNRRQSQMSKFIIALAALVGSSVVFFNLRASLANVRRANEKILSQVRVLRAQSAELEERRSGLQRQLNASQDRRR